MTMTWGQFKAHVEKNGVQEDDVVKWIDVQHPRAQFLDVERIDGQVEVISTWGLPDMPVERTIEGHAVDPAAAAAPPWVTKPVRRPRPRLKRNRASKGIDRRPECHYTK